MIAGLVTASSVLARLAFSTVLGFPWIAANGMDAPEKRMVFEDFEGSGDPASYAGLNVRDVQASIVDADAGRSGRCLQLQTAEPAGFCSLNLIQPVEVEKNLLLSFDHREEIEAGFEGAYLGIGFSVGKEECLWTSDEFSSSWRHCEVALGKLKPRPGQELKPGMSITRIQIYGRVKEKTAAKGQTKARMSVWIDNLTVKVAEPPSRVTDRTRLSWSNPPLFNWDAAGGSGTQRLQYWLESPGNGQARNEVAAPVNFHTPVAPLEPGTYQWRVWSTGELAEGWSDSERVVVLPESHRFATAPVPAAELAKMVHPRLRKLAEMEEPNLTVKRKAELLRKAKKIFERGVPEHPGPHVPGDPRWPTWIEWYGKVAGGITGSTGKRLEDLGRCAVLTGEPQAISWAKELALAACDWDPDGGSAMKLGDIGAHHLLRGLNWCYDAACGAMTEAEREKLRGILVRRAQQFYQHLNPFRHGEANNHAWLQAFGLAETGIVLLGEHPEAGDWAEYVRQLYLGRFLPCLGFQGDNNEGIGYWDYGLSFVVPFGDLLQQTCGIDLFQHPWLSQTARFPLYCAPPNAWAVSFADTGMPNHGTRGPAATKWVRELGLRTKDPYALWYAGERTQVNGIVPKPPADLPGSILFRHIGVGIFNTSLVDGNEGVSVAMHSGPYQAGHQHPDQNSFVIHAYGGKLAIDGGYYDWYGSPHFKAYSANTLAHNTLLVDGEGQAACAEGADGRVLEWFDSPSFGYVAGDASDPEVYQGRLRRFERRLLFLKPGLVAVQDLVAAAKAPATCDWLLHAVVPIELDKAAQAFSITCPEAALRGRFLAPGGLNMEVKTGFPVEPVNRYSRDPVPKDKYFPEWILHAKPGAAAADQEFCAVMQVQRLGSQPEPAARIEPVACQNGHAARVVRPGGETRILFRSADGAGAAARGAEIETDGACAAVETTAQGEPRRALLASGTYLRYRNKEMIRRQEPGCQVWGGPSD